MPSISPAKAKNKKAEPRARQKADDTIVALPEASKRHQLIWRPDRPKPIDHPERLANLLAFQLPKERAVKPAATMPEPPKLAVGQVLPATPLGDTKAPLPPPPTPKLFTPPASRQKAASRPKLVEPPALASEAPAVSAGGGTLAQTLSTDQRLPGAPARQFVPPDSKRPAGRSPGAELLAVEAPPELGASADSVRLNAVVLGLKPGQTPGLPEGTQVARIAAAPEVRKGTPSGGGGGEVQVQGLDLTVRSNRAGSSGSQPVIAALVSKTIFASRAVVDQRRTVLSLPQSPAKVPSYVKELFKSRDTYLTVLEPPNRTNYSGDWFLWFAERNPLPGPDPRVQPPIAFKSVDPASEQSTIPAPVKGRIRLAAIIRKTGFVDEVRLISGVSDGVDRAFTEALRRWTFQPALRSGIMVDLDACIEIPFDARPRPNGAVR